MFIIFFIKNLTFPFSIIINSLFFMCNLFLNVIRNSYIYKKYSMIVIRLLFLVISLGLINAFVLSWGIVDISQLYEIPYLKEFGFWNILGLALLKGVLEGNTKIELEKRKIGIQGEGVSEEQITKYIVTGKQIGRAHV